MTSPTYHRLSYYLTKNITKKEKQDNGIFFTQPKTIIKNIQLLKPYMKRYKICVRTILWIV